MAKLNEKQIRVVRNKRGNLLCDSQVRTLPIFRTQNITSTP